MIKKWICLKKMLFMYLNNDIILKKYNYKRVGALYRLLFLYMNRSVSHQSRWIITLIVSILAITKLVAQDPIFSQYYASSLYLNPALAASEQNITAGFNSRVQWKSIVAPYTTNQATAILPIYSKTEKFQNIGGVGLSFFNHKAGQIGLNTTGVNLNLAYVIQLSDDHHILAGVQVGWIQKKIDFGSGQWGSQFDPINGWDSSINPGEFNFLASSSYLDVGSGFVYYYKPGRNIRETGASFYAGYSAYHMNRPNESVVKSIESNLPVLHKGIAGLEFTMNDHWNFSPNLLYAKQNASTQLNFGLYSTYIMGEEHDLKEWTLAPNKLMAGAWYRMKDAYIATLAFGNEFYTIAFSYDVNSSSLRESSRGKGAYELSIKLSAPKLQKTIRVYGSPRF